MHVKTALRLLVSFGTYIMLSNAGVNKCFDNWPTGVIMMTVGIIGLAICDNAEK